MGGSPNPTPNQVGGPIWLGRTSDPCFVAAMVATEDLTLTLTLTLSLTPTLTLTKVGDRLRSFKGDFARREAEVLASRW